MNEMTKEFKPALILLLAFTLICGVAYPALVTLVAQLGFNGKANGSLIVEDGLANGSSASPEPAADAANPGNRGRIRGSRLVGQAFNGEQYFWSRPSATGPVPYHGGASSGSNLGPLAEPLATAVAARIAALKASDPGNATPIPVDLVTASGSGLDPHISPAAAAWQAGRVARVRGLDLVQVQALVAAHTESRTLGVLGEPRVNVLGLNLALDGVVPR